MGLKNLTAELYSKELFEDWVNRKNIIPIEKVILDKYLIDTSKKVLEAGTGGGRISFYIETMGFKNISAFDIVPEMINRANLLAKRRASNIEFKVADAANLSEYKTDTYDYLIYLQQVLSCSPNRDLFSKSLNESFRILRKNGIVIFSFLDMASRIYNSTLNLIINFLRKIRNEEVMEQYLPWIKINKRLNWKLFNKNQPANYWVKKNEIISDLMNVGFSILEAKNENQFIINHKARKGMLYIVCKK